MIDINVLDKLFRHCFYTKSEIESFEDQLPKDCVQVHGISANFVFHPSRLKEAEAEIKDMLNQLPDTIIKGTWFPDLCFDKNDEQWGEHEQIEQLCCLAIGLKLGRWMLPKHMWLMFPGAMPFFQRVVDE